MFEKGGGGGGGSEYSTLDEMCFFIAKDLIESLVEFEGQFLLYG